MLPFSTLLRISRPRFWHYVLGPMLILFAVLSQYADNYIYTSLYKSLDFLLSGEVYMAYITTLQDIGDSQVIISLCIMLFFTFPLNLFIYGINDIADNDTDKYNTKKLGYEEALNDTMHDSVKKNILFFTIVSIVCLSFLISQIGNISYIYILTTSIILLIPVFFFSYYYSVLPIRAKAKPFLDGLFNILYIISPFILYIFFQAFYKYTISINTLYIFIASYAWTIALHFYSAIPDIYADAQAGLRTTAVYLGKSGALIYCGILYLIATISSYPTLGWFSIIAGCIYIGMMAVSYRYDDIFWLYKKFPLINLIVGFALFWYIVLAL